MISCTILRKYSRCQIIPRFFLYPCVKKEQGKADSFPLPRPTSRFFPTGRATREARKFYNFHAKRGSGFLFYTLLSTYLRYHLRDTRSNLLRKYSMSSCDSRLNRDILPKIRTMFFFCQSCRRFLCFDRYDCCSQM